MIILFSADSAIVEVNLLTYDHFDDIIHINGYVTLSDEYFDSFHINTSSIQDHVLFRSLNLTFVESTTGVILNHNNQVVDILFDPDNCVTIQMKSEKPNSSLVYRFFGTISIQEWIKPLTVTIPLYMNFIFNFTQPLEKLYKSQYMTSSSIQLLPTFDKVHQVKRIGHNKPFVTIYRDEKYNSDTFTASSMFYLPALLFPSNITNSVAQLYSINIKLLGPVKFQQIYSNHENSRNETIWVMINNVKITSINQFPYNTTSPSSLTIFLNHFDFVTVTSAFSSTYSLQLGGSLKIVSLYPDLTKSISDQPDFNVINPFSIGGIFISITDENEEVIDGFIINDVHIIEITSPLFNFITIQPITTNDNIIINNYISLPQINNQKGLNFSKDDISFTTVFNPINYYHSERYPLSIQTSVFHYHLDQPTNQPFLSNKTNQNQNYNCIYSKTLSIDNNDPSMIKDHQQIAFTTSYNDIFSGKNESIYSNHLLSSYLYQITLPKIDYIHDVNLNATTFSITTFIQMKAKHLYPPNNAQIFDVFLPTNTTTIYNNISQAADLIEINYK
jgi:hypothetical protein